MTLSALAVPSGPQVNLASIPANYFIDIMDIENIKFSFLSDPSPIIGNACH